MLIAGAITRASTAFFTKCINGMHAITFEKISSEKKTFPEILSPFFENLGEIFLLESTKGWKSPF